MALLLASPQGNAQEYEYEPDEGLHREEWYDPSDWFDTTPGVDYEQDLFDSPFDNDWDDDDFDYDYDSDWDWDYFDEEWDSDNNVWNNASIPRGDQNYGTDGENYGWHYDWNPVSGSWRSDYGQYSSMYTYDAPNDFGWHYDWNPREQQWDSDYGWHASNWGFDRQRFNYDRQSQQNQASQASARQRQNQDREKAREQMAQTRDRHTISGEIEALRRINTSSQGNQQAQRAIADVRLDNGKSVVVDLTRHRSKVQEGDRITLRGRTIQLDGRQVLVASDIRVGNQNRQSREAMGSAMGQQRETSATQRNYASNQSRSVQISGRLENLEETDLDNARQNHTLLRLRLENGRRAIVDLGANFAQRYGRDRLERLLDRADQGDRIVVQGQRQQVNGREIIRASQFRLEGRNVLQQGSRQSGGSGRWRDLTEID